jgi:signal transduction histidine kinase
MTLLDLAKLYNFSGVATILVISIWVASKYPSPFFKPWLLAYSCGAGLVACELVGSVLTGNVAFHTLQMFLVVSVIWLFAETGRALEGRKLPRLGYWAMVVPACILAVVWQMAGKPWLGAFGPAVAIYAGAHFWLGRELIRFDRRHATASNRFWLGWPQIMTGLWLFTYPLLADTSVFWLGFLVSGILNMLVGMGMALFLVDQTARDLRVSKDELAADLDVSNSFIQTMSHELRTPLGSIKTAAFLVGQTDGGTLSDKQRELLNIIDGQSELLNRLVGDLLDHSRIESGLLVCNPEAEDRADLAWRSVRALEREYAAKGVTLELVGADASLPLEADGTRLMQVISNLLVNALKFTPAGGKVTVTAGAHGDEALVQVQDSGIGIAPEYHDRIFQKYYQVDASTKRKVGGLGLGLAISKVIVEQGHGGRLAVDSDLGRGACFRVELPMVAARRTELERV